MRHQKSGRKLGRNSPHRKAMFSNMVASLIKHGRIETTESKAKELRRFAEPTINWAVSVAKLEAKGRGKQSDAEKAEIVHAIRMAGRILKDDEAMSKLFHEVGPGFMNRPGGYTRILKTRTRVGDAAPMAFIELTPSELAKAAPAAAAATTPGAKGKAGKAVKAGKAEPKAAKPKKAKKDADDE